MSDKDSYQPVRKPRPVYGSVSGYFAFRGQDTIWFESTLERDLIQKLEFNDNVMQVVCQPIEIQYRTNLGNLSTYTPDFLVQFFETPLQQSPLLIEVKPRATLQRDWKMLKPKLRAGFQYAKDRGWDFKIYDETRIRDPLLANIQFLRRYRNSDFQKDETIQILNRLDDFGTHSVNGLANSLFKADQKILQAIAHIWFLVERKYICCDLTQPLKPTSMIWVNDERRDDLIQEYV
ncbi:heteromeric transposase endonuclease subunit TnsA [Wohlfahrtiimonas chitiniclastica]|uniref:TnsA endonuclease N-terminal domain-containing protein n=1 Tax=Wohlfahrtiimonas chitiniclastica TaxID=400946 RepID=UPI001BD1717D|nr:TnsA endonuclease N-terminal domain-containing protein [Wohlfahrtiimonas chitiniclastica]MBS7820737.1 heteromeric transposase endonuclease subunit TnsA [Wohlfahrtiimonas chitiniclastica]